MTGGQAKGAIFLKIVHFLARAEPGDKSEYEASYTSVTVKKEPSIDFMDLFVEDQAMVYAFVRSLVPNFADAEEIFQQVAVTLWRKRETYDPARRYVSGLGNRDRQEPYPQFQSA